MPLSSRLYLDPAPLLADPGLDAVLADDLELHGLVDAPAADHVARERASVERAVRGGARAFRTDDALALLRPLAWDSEHFGAPCADVARLYGGPSPLSHVIDHAARAGISLLSARCRADRPATVQALEAAGFRWVDTSVEIGAALPSDLPAADPRTRAARADDVPALRAIARTFTRNRFHFDPRIPPDRAAGVYEAWVENVTLGRLAGQSLIVAERDGRVAGFSGLKRAPADDPWGVAVLTLIAVAPEARGQGVIDALYDGVLRGVAPARRIWTSTQVHNAPSLRAFARRGLRPFCARHVLHRWATT